MKQDNKGLIFTNLVDFDMKWGHRNDFKAYAKGLEEFDVRLKEIIDTMKDSDILFITADHGCDPTMPGTDHSREHVPFLAYGKNLKENINLGTRNSFADMGQTVAEILNVEKIKNGESFLENVDTYKKSEAQPKSVTYKKPRRMFHYKKVRTYEKIRR